MPMPAPAAYFLSLCLLYPQPGREEQLGAAAATGPAWAADLVAAFAAEPLEVLQVEHTRLFVNAEPGVPCSPYEAAYVDGRLLTATTAAVAAVYAEWGLVHAQEMADYLPVELQFVAYLAELAGQVDAEEQAQIEAARRRFEAGHLRPWLLRFAADLQEHARLAFYRQVGAYLADLAHTLEESP